MTGPRQVPRTRVVGAVLGGIACFAAVWLSGAVAWADDICEASDVRAMLDAAEATDEYRDCDLGTIAGQFAQSGLALIDSASLLPDLYRQVAEDYVPSEDEPPPENGQTWEGDIDGGRALLGDFQGTDLTDDDQAESATAQMESANAILQRLAGKLSGLVASDVDSGQRYSFCKVLLELKLSQKWRRRFDSCRAD